MSIRTPISLLGWILGERLPAKNMQSIISSVGSREIDRHFGKVV